MKNLVN
ncbi:hypothetical protein F383_14706 [Gossypium arboreum]|nr:hypothetical protein F383_14706 [Gossypium arboreum]